MFCTQFCTHGEAFLLYLVKNNRVYYLRIRIPKDVNQYFPSSEIKKSLHTSSYRQASSQVRLFVAEAEKVFMMIRSNMLTPPQIFKIVEKYLDDILSHRDRLYEEELEKYTPEHVKKYLKGITEASLYQNQQHFQNRTHVQKCGGKARELLEKQHIEYDEASPEFKQLCMELVKADITYDEVLLSRIKGDIHPYDVDLSNKRKSNTLQEVIKAFIHSRSKTSKARSLAKLPESPPVI